MRTLPDGNCGVSSYIVPDEQLVPVPCKCCGGLHPACGCWNRANYAKLEGHDCARCMRDVDRGGMHEVWDSKHPSQQRSRLYFHKDQYDKALLRLRTMQAALMTFSKIADPEFDGPKAYAEDVAKTAIAQITESAAILGQDDPTGFMHRIEDA